MQLKKSHIVFIVLFFSFFAKGQSQHSCTTSDPIGGDYLSQVPSSTYKTLNTPVTLKVYIHIIRTASGSGGISEDKVYKGICGLRDDFSPFGIYFNVQPFLYVDNDYYYNYTLPKEYALNLTQGHTDGIDIYLLDEHIYNSARAIDLPGSAMVIGGKFFYNNVVNVIDDHLLSHEMGHCLGLSHTHYGSGVNGCPELVNGSNCLTCGDYVCDTPPDVDINLNVDANCIWVPTANDPLTDANGDSYDPDEKNIMSYSTPLCKQYLTQGQADRMFDMIANHPSLMPCVTTTTQNASSNLDLSIRDTDFDLGWGYTFGYYFDKSPDIWVRNQPDGLTNQIHEDPEYHSLNPVYVYVRVRNIGCIATSGTEIMDLYWSKASSSSSWPANWDGTQPTVGNSIGSSVIPMLEPGEEEIIQFQWNILDPNTHNNWASCLLVRIDAGLDDPITTDPDLGQEVFLNNNIALRNVTVLDDFFGKKEIGWVGGIYYPHGRFMYIGNSTEDSEMYNFHFEVPDEYRNNSIVDEAEIRLIFDDEGWNLMVQSGIEQNPNIEIVSPKEVIIHNNSVSMNNVLFSADKRIPIYVGFSFYSEAITTETHYEFRVSQTRSSDGLLIGAEHFELYKHQRNPFQANAGADKEIFLNQSITLDAGSVNEAAEYNWYNSDGDLIYTGEHLSVSPEVSTEYQLEVIAQSDGFKDYDNVEVIVKNCQIISISPNPNSTGLLVVDYQLEGVSSSYLMISAPYSYITNNYIVDINKNKITMPLSTLAPGSYTLFLVVDGQIIDSENLLIQ